MMSLTAFVFFVIFHHQRGEGDEGEVMRGGGRRQKKYRCVEINDNEFR